MKKLPVIVLIMICIFYKWGIAQSVFPAGPAIGLGYRQMAGPQKGMGNLGGYAGITTDIRLYKAISIQPGISYAWKGYYHEMARMIFIYNFKSENLHLNYVLLNIPVRYKFYNGCSFHAECSLECWLQLNIIQRINSRGIMTYIRLITEFWPVPVTSLSVDL